MNAVITEDLFRDSLVFAKREACRAATGETQAMHFEKRHDVLIERAVVVELIRQVEDQVRLKLIRLLSKQVQVVEDGEVFDGVAKFAEGRQHAGFG